MSEETSAAKAGKELQDPDTMTTNNTTSSDDMHDRVNNILPGERPLEGLKAHKTGPVQYTVLSVRDGPVTAYEVNVGTMECSCPDFEYNAKADEHEICKHLAYAVLLGKEQFENAEGMANTYMVYVENARRLFDSMEHRLDQLDTQLDEASVLLRDAQGEQAERDAQTDSQPEDDAGSDVDVVDAADALRDAYDDVVDDMQVTTNAGYVWVQTGQDTPDQLSGPGNVSVFDAFLKEPEQVTFVHDDHDLAGSKPGEWWKNAIAPGDVEAYIDEVLR
jgi:hypothetical protein